MSASVDPVVVVLAGGEGRRMGGAKPLQRFGETTLIGRALELARGYGGAVAVALRDPAQVADIGEARLLVDDPSVGGPIAGLASALAHGRSCGARFVLTLPCDTPLLPSDLRSRLAAALADDRNVALASSGGRLHPACALWRVEALDQLAGYLATGRSSLKGFAETCGMATVDWAVGAADPFANANTPDDLRRLQPADHALVGA